MTAVEIEMYLQFLQDAAELVNPGVGVSVVKGDANDDPTIYTAVSGRADVLCTMDRHFYAPAVISFCRQRGIEIMNDVELLRRLRTRSL